MEKIARRTVLAAAATSLFASRVPRANAAQPYKIGFMYYDTSIPFASNLIKGLREEAAKNNVRLSIESGNNDLSTQVSVVQQFIVQRMDMIMVSPNDPQGLVPVLRQAVASNIPVMAVNEAVDVSSGLKLVTYVGCDDYAYGKRQAELVKQAVGNNGRIALILGILGSAAQVKRQAGLIDGLKASSNIRILQAQPANWNNAKALSLTQDYLSKFPHGTLDAIVDQGPEGVNGANFAFANARTDVKFILGDYPADVRNAIIKGSVYGTVDQDPTPQGTTAISDGVAWLSGRRPEVPRPNHFLDVQLITSANAKQVPPAWGT